MNVAQVGEGLTMPSGDKIRFMALSDSILTCTGFANQTKQLCQTLSKQPDFDVTNISWNTVTQPLKHVAFADSDEEFNFRIMGGGKEQYARDLLGDYFAMFKPNIFFCLLDSFMLFPWIMQQDFTPAKSIMYFPSDGEWFPIGCENVLRKFTNPVAMSKFAQEQLLRLYGVQSDYIPHGVNTDKFYPIPNDQKMATRARYGIPEDNFVVGIVARNQGRKNMGAVVTTFAEFAKDKEDVTLFLHTDMLDPAAACDLTNLIRRHKIEHKVRASGMRYFLGAKAEQMKEIYGIADVHFLTTTGEGFGIPIVESLACEVPNITTSYTTTPELLGYDKPADWKGSDFVKGKCGLGVPIATEIVGSWNVNRGFISEPLAVKALQYAYDNREEMKQLGKNGRKYVVQNYDWNRVVGQAWTEYIKKMVGWQ